MMKLMAENPEVTLLTLNFDEAKSICKALDVQVCPPSLEGCLRGGAANLSAVPAEAGG